MKTVVVIVAHPDDETLWAGGTIMNHPSWNWFIVCLCRKSDMERATKFQKALKVFNAEGIMGDLDDGPDQKVLDVKELESVILDLLPQKQFDLVITHNPSGEYTRHRRHEEVSNAVIKLWQKGTIAADELWTFAYEDGNKEYFPRAIEHATSCRLLTTPIWLRKYSIITETYGFETGSWEAQTTPRSEAFWQFTNLHDVEKFLRQSEIEII